MSYQQEGGAKQHPKRVVSKRVVLAVPVYRNFLQKVFPGSATLAEESYGFWYSWTPKTGTRLHMPKPSFNKTALLFPLEVYDVLWRFITHSASLGNSRFLFFFVCRGTMSRHLSENVVTFLFKIVSGVPSTRPHFGSHRLTLGAGGVTLQL